MLYLSSLYRIRAFRNFLERVLTMGSVSCASIKLPLACIPPQMGDEGEENRFTQPGVSVPCNNSTGSILCGCHCETWPNYEWRQKGNCFTPVVGHDCSDAGERLICNAFTRHFSIGIFPARLISRRALHINFFCGDWFLVRWLRTRCDC